jgi:hypothetical protein
MKNYVTTLGIALTVALPNATQAQGIAPPPVPTNIEVSAPNEVFVGHGVGTQNYGMSVREFSWACRRGIVYTAGPAVRRPG